MLPPTLLLKLARLCDRVYDDDPVLHDCKEEFFDVEDTQVLVMETFSHVKVVFRGTESWNDWKTNLGLKLTPYNNIGQVHSGFLEALSKVSTQLLVKLKAINKPVYITGHSLGGALAVLFGEQCFNAGIKVDHIVTFGQPRVGDQAFVSHIEDNIPYTRLVNRYDFITIVPPSWGCMGGYRHSENLMMFDENFSYIPSINARDMVWDYIWDRLKWAVPNFIAQTIDHHSIDNYIKSCEQLIGPL